MELTVQNWRVIFWTIVISLVLIAIAVMFSSQHPVQIDGGLMGG